ncbi:unnamed protein product [Trypanosoma congolense IL3000]|uniref:WGS project CAEQ00000000 data, annotated contig 451 n=1 Tax=Trypanosoma congolense (strain IL3000) TaxID=1068625 RepID=F9WG18_TRYCI|nr:unnamed protein product [Trypanosoma congolense IL3000]
MFKVRLPGFASIDAGGPYRDILSQLASEIMTVHPSGEFQQNPVFKDYGSDGQLAVMPNVAWSTDSQSASVFAFFGKLLAACFVSKDLLTVEFPPLFWKLLLGEETTVRDLRVVDRDITRQLAPEELMKRSPEELEERFPGICESWRQLCDESSRLESCAELPPTSPYVAGALAAHITSHEIRRYSLAMACIQQGFGEVIPLYTLHAFRWQQVEHIICGTPELSYEGLCGVCEVSLPPEHAEMFNEVVQSMSDKDRRLLLRFTTGQTRLPLKKNIKVEQSDAALDTLPKSSTCFFTLYLPVYSSVTIMRKRMLYAIRHCEAIDGDGEAEEPIILNM